MVAAVSTHVCDPTCQSSALLPVQPLIQASQKRHLPTASSCLPLQGTARQIHSIATHPSQPDKCASGGSNGTVAVWDMRFTTAPMVASTSKQHAGDVWQVCHAWASQADTG